MSEEITKRRVTMRSAVVAGIDTDGQPVVQLHECVDYVRPDFLEAFVADAQTKWQQVVVSDEPDAGPLGYHGPTHVPGHLDHPLAGQTFPATPGSDADRALTAPIQEG